MRRSNWITEGVEKSTLLQHIGNLCACARLNAGKTQKDVADACNTTSQNISKFECGRQNSAILLYYYIVEFGVIL